MAFREIYHRQVALLLRVIPVVAQEDCFALKGGTAINLFVRNMPRLSVDIDLTYVPISSRPVTVQELETARERMIAAIVGDMPGDDRRFLVSFERGEPDWQLLRLAEAQHLPAVLWRQKNLNALPRESRAQLVERLESVLLVPRKRPAGNA